MQNKSFLDFDISVSADKKRRSKRGSASGGFESSVRTCEVEGCSEEAKYRAPKSPKDLDNFHWFCLKHVKEYNTRWNYFKNHSEEEFEKELNLSKTWGRKTQPFGSKSSVNRSHSDGNSKLRFGIEDPYSFIDGFTKNDTNSINTKKEPSTLPKIIATIVKIIISKKPAINLNQKPAYSCFLDNFL